MSIQTGDYVGIGGFIVAGTAPKHVLLRAMGPSMAKLGVPNVLRNPAIELRNSEGELVRSNNNWRETQEFAIKATGMAPGSDLEAAIDVILPAPIAIPGATGTPTAAYTVIVKSEDGVSGLALFEVYDLNPASGSKLANMSSRAVVTPGDNTLIAGFIITGSGTNGIVIRGLGPSLSISGPLLDPVLQLRDGNGELLAFNDNWKDNSSRGIDSSLRADPKESEIQAILPPGNYTALLNGNNETSGVGVIEVYDYASMSAADVTPFQTGTVSNIEAQHVALNSDLIADTFRLVFTLPPSINQSAIGSRAALQGTTTAIKKNASAADIQAAIVALRGFYAYGQFGNPELIAGKFSYFADIAALNRDPIVTGSATAGFTIYFGSTVGSPTAYNTWVAGLPLVRVAVP